MRERERECERAEHTKVQQSKAERQETRMGARERGALFDLQDAQNRSGNLIVAGADEDQTERERQEAEHIHVLLGLVEHRTQQLLADILVRLTGVRIAQTQDGTDLDSLSRERERERENW